MKATESASNPLNGSSAPSFSLTMRAIDMTGDPELRALWFPGRDAAAVVAARAKLPAGGSASPLGYWLVADEGLEDSPRAGPRIVVADRGDSPPQPTIEPGISHPPGRRFRSQTVKIKAPDPNDGDVVVSTMPGSALVIASESAWMALAGPVLLAICQVWRFQAIEAELERLTQNAVDDLHFANAPSLASLGQSRRLMDLGWKTRAVIVDLTYFQTPLTDPFAFFDSRRSARVYRLLADRFGLDDWSDSIDHRAEVVEATFETITEKLYHLKSHAHDVVLEVLIVVILVIDILMRLWEVIA